MKGFIGVRIENGELEVGFKAATRAEYQRCLRMVETMANGFWPPESMDLSRDPAEPPRSGDFADEEPPAREQPADPRSHDEIRDDIWADLEERQRRTWLEKQGLT